jgi:ferredoxin
VSGSRGMGPVVTSGTRWMEKYYHVRGVGGTTLHFTGESHRIHPDAMKMKTRFGVAADWPIDYAELEPFYAEAEELIGVAGPESQGARWRSRKFPLPAHPFSYAARTLGRGAAALGLDWQANSRAALSQVWNGRPPCNYCGGCNDGCPRGDKGSADVTFIAAALATGRCVIRPDSPVLRIEAGSADRVTSLVVGPPTAASNALPRHISFWPAAPLRPLASYWHPTDSLTKAARSASTLWTRSMSPWVRCILIPSTRAAACPVTPFVRISIHPMPFPESSVDFECITLPEKAS